MSPVITMAANGCQAVVSKGAGESWKGRETTQEQALWAP